MKEIATLFPLESTHINLTDDEWCERLLPMEEPTDPKEGLFLYATKAGIGYSKPETTLASNVTTPLGVVLPTETAFNRSEKTNLAFLARYVNKQDDMVMFRFDIFSNTVAEPLMLMRLFAPGDIFVTYALPSGYEGLKLSSEFEDVQNLYFLDQEHLPIFKKFFQDYWLKLRMLSPFTKQDGSVARWSKKIGNALYFFNKSYFTKTQIVSHRDARFGNIDRLMSLITALDALLGISPSGDELAKNADYLLKYLYKNVEKSVLDLYELRSSWVHANEQKLNGNITDQKINELSRFVQKVCLINIELFCDKELRNEFEKSKKKHIIEYLQLVPNKIKSVATTVIQSGQLYDRW